jgi:hypothetical protein
MPTHWVNSADSHVLEPLDLWLGGWFLRPERPRLSSEYVKRQVHVSLQHARAGTFPRTRAVSTEIVDGVDDDVRPTITGGPFSTLFTASARVRA